jgi:hypothetical protein
MKTEQEILDEYGKILIKNNMNYIRFENFLGKDIVTFEKTIGNRFIKKRLIENHSFRYTMHQGIERNFYGFPYNSFYVSLDNELHIKHIALFFNKIIDDDFYNLFKKDYGLPSHILKVKSKKIISEGMSDDNDFKQYLTQSELEVYEATFEENPLYIIWKEDTFEIKFLMKREEGRSNVTFSAL